jgi:hypothetical protein
MENQFMMTDSSSGIIKFSSPWSFSETVKRIEVVLDAKKIKLFARKLMAARSRWSSSACAPYTASRNR